MRRKEREERKRVRELRRKEKERRKIERTNRRALRLLEKNSMLARQEGDVMLDRRKGSVVDPSVLKALREGDEQSETESPSTNPAKEEEEDPTASLAVKEEDEEVAADEDEDDDEEEAEDDEEEEEEAEDEDDEDDDDDDEKPLQVISQRIEADETATTSADANKNQAEVETKKEWPELPPAPLKGILISPGYRFVFEINLGQFSKEFFKLLFTTFIFIFTLRYPIARNTLSDTYTSFQERHDV